MNKVKRAKKLFLLLIIVLLSLILIKIKREQPQSLQIDYSKEAQQLDRVFLEKSPQAAVIYFNDKYKNYDYQTIHILDHALGEKLYKYDGTKGIVYCPESLLSGCFHGFFGAAFEKEGENIITGAEEICKLRGDFFKTSGCLHGIGHGLLTRRRHSNFTLALKDCDQVKYSISLGNFMCYTGVFMEYHVITTHNQGSQSIILRDFNPQNPYLPCTDVEERYQPACYLQLPQWWTDVLNHDYIKMVSLCSRVTNKTNKEYCYRSIGMVVTRERKMNLKDIDLYCHKANQQEAYFCLEESAKLISVLQKKVETSPCDGLKDSQQNTCRVQVKKFMCEMSHIC